MACTVCCCDVIRKGWLQEGKLYFFAGCNMSIGKKIFKAGVVIMAYYSKSLIGLCRNRN